MRRFCHVLTLTKAHSLSPTGSFHASDIISVFGLTGPFVPLTIEMQSRWLAFANNLDVGAGPTSAIASLTFPSSHSPTCPDTLTGRPVGPSEFLQEPWLTSPSHRSIELDAASVFRLPFQAHLRQLPQAGH